MSLDIHYHSFNALRADEKWNAFWKLDRKVMFETLGFPDRPITKEDFEYELLYLDLRFGAVTAELYEPDREEAFLFMLLSVFIPQSPLIKKESLYNENHALEMPVKDIQACIDFFDEEKVRTWIINADTETAGKINIWEEDLEWILPAISQYIKQITPIIHDLLQNPSSIFIWEVNGDINNHLLRERQKMHSEQFFCDHPGIFA